MREKLTEERSLKIDTEGARGKTQEEKRSREILTKKNSFM